jgi:hypothetical protein
VEAPVPMKQETPKVINKVESIKFIEEEVIPSVIEDVKEAKPIPKQPEPIPETICGRHLKTV